MKEMKVFSPTAILGYGFPRKSFEKGLAQKPDVIAVDAGSTDPGPYYLGSGKSFTDASAVKRDLVFMMKGARQLDIPLIIGSAGGSGADSHLKWCLEIIEEIVAEQGLSFNLAQISAEINPHQVKKWYAEGKIIANDYLPCNEEQIEQANNIVAQMGHEPIIKALAQGANLILCGRAYDPSVFAALPIMQGYDEALAVHMGKILECAAIACEPGSGRDSMMGIIGKDYFQVEPLAENRRCTTTSVAAHTLYEKSDPLNLPGPGGILNLSETTFTQITPQKVEVRGSTIAKTSPYLLKLEGAALAGYRTIAIAGIRDPLMIKDLDSILKAVTEQVSDNFDQRQGEQDYQIIFRSYGKDGVMGNLEYRDLSCHELGLIIEVVADTQKRANTICSFTRSTLLHYGYRGRIATAGNLAFPYSPSDFEGGAVYRFNIHHLVEVADPLTIFPFEIKQIFGGGQKSD